MGKKDYQAIAARIYQQRRLSNSGVVTEALEQLAEGLADIFQADNDRFDRARFIEACETGRTRGFDPGCDGAGPHRNNEVRVLPLPGDGNLILCRACYAHELAWRVDRNRELAKEARYPLPPWDTLKVYGQEEP